MTTPQPDCAVSSPDNASTFLSGATRPISWRKAQLRAPNPDVTENHKAPRPYLRMQDTRSTEELKSS
jgi:hypothetical protein